MAASPQTSTPRLCYVISELAGFVGDEKDLFAKRLGQNLHDNPGFADRLLDGLERDYIGDISPKQVRVSYPRLIKKHADPTQ